MEQLIIEILKLHPEGMLGSVIRGMVTAHTHNANGENIQGTLSRMIEEGILTTIPRALNDGDRLYALQQR